MKKDGRLREIGLSVLREWRGADEPPDLAQNVHHAADFMKSILRAAGAQDGVEAEELRAHWREIAGDFLRPYAEPVSIKNGHLVLQVSQPSMRFHLEQMKGELLRKFRARLGEDRVKSIRFQIG